MPNSDSDWDYPLTDEDLRAIDSAISSAPPPKRHRLSYIQCDEDAGASVDSPPKPRRRLPSSLFVFQQQQQQRRRNANVSTGPFSPCSSRYYYGRNSSQFSAFQGNCSYTRLSFHRGRNNPTRPKLLHFYHHCVVTASTV